MINRINRTPAVRRGPTKARRMVGDLHGPAPADVPRQIRKVVLQVDQLDDGTWRFTSPKLPGWGVGARNGGEVVAAIRRSFAEVQVAAYSDWRGTAYDASIPEYRRSRPRARSRRRCDVYDPTMWRLVADTGNWISPAGHQYPETRQVVQRVIAARLQLGLAARPDPVNPDSNTMSMNARKVEAMTHRRHPYERGKAS